MKKFLLSGFVAMMAAFASPASADAAAYGAAGCGLGSVIFGSSPGFVQIFAATTNGTSGNQTFGITTGTLNCADTGGGTASAKAFIETNREALAKDISRGQGETIASLSTLAGCSDSRAVGASLQKNFSTIFPSGQVSDTAVSGSVINVLRSERSLSCKKVR